METHTRRNVLVSVAVFIVLLVCGGAAYTYVYMPQLVPSFLKLTPADPNALRWDINKNAGHRIDALLLVSTADDPNLPMLAAVDFSARTLTPLADVRSKGAAITSARLSDDGKTLAYTTVDAKGVSQILFADPRGNISPVQPDEGGDADTIRNGIDWNVGNTLAAFSAKSSSGALIPDGLPLGDINNWMVLVFNLATGLSTPAGPGFAPYFSPASQEFVYLSPLGVTSAKIGAGDATRREVLVSYPSGLQPESLTFSADKNAAVVTYKNYGQADVYSVSWNPVRFALLKSFPLPQTVSPLEGASPVSVVFDGSSLSLLSVADSGADSGPKLLLNEGPLGADPLLSIPFPKEVVRAAVAEWIAPVVPNTTSQ